MSTPDVDEVVVDRLVRGHRVRSNRAERAAATARLDALGATAREIAHQLRRTIRSVQRYRATNRVDSGCETT